MLPLSHLLVSAPILAQNLHVKNVYLKLDNLQPASSFKIRGLSHSIEMAMNRLGNLSTLVSSSGGNAGFAATIAAKTFNLKIVVFVPQSTPAFAIETLQEHGATVIVSGIVWDEAHQAAIQYVDSLPTLEPGFLVHPFEGQDTWIGHGSLVHEIWKDGVIPDVSTIILTSRLSFARLVEVVFYAGF